jgi:tetratricopeptide (TPR) repeat protein
MFALEDELVTEILTAINTRLSASLSATARALPTSDVEAYQLYLQGRAIQFRADVASLQRSEEWFHQAIARDPDFASALSAIALGRWAQFFLGDPSKLQEAENLARRALAADRTIAEPRQILGNVLAVRSRFAEAEQCFNDLFREDGADGLAYCDHALFVLASTGHLQRALQQAQKGYQRDPANPAVVLLLSLMHCLLAQDREAVRLADRARSLGYASPLSRFQYACAALRAARNADAAEHVLEGRPATVRSKWEAPVRLAFHALDEGRERGTAVRALHLLAEGLSAEEMLPDLNTYLMLMFVLLGDLDGAYDIAGRTLDYYEKIDSCGLRWGLLWIPETRAFRQHPRFHDLVTRIGMMEYWREYGAPDDCDVLRGKLVCR